LFSTALEVDLYPRSAVGRWRFLPHFLAAIISDVSLAGV